MGSRVFGRSRGSMFLGCVCWLGRRPAGSRLPNQAGEPRRERRLRPQWFRRRWVEMKCPRTISIASRRVLWPLRLWFGGEKLRSRRHCYIRRLRSLLESSLSEVPVLLVIYESVVMSVGKMVKALSECGVALTTMLIHWTGERGCAL